MLRLADLIEKHNDQIATLETWDTGKPYEQAAKIEVPMVVRLLRYYAGKSESQLRKQVYQHLFRVPENINDLLLVLQAGQIKFTI